MSALAPARGELRLLLGPDRLAPYDDVGIGPALLREVGAAGEGGWLRLYRPAPTVAFGRRDTLSPGFQDAAALAAAAGYAPVLRAPGGRAAVYDDRALCVDLVVADADPGALMLTRFAEFADLLVQALSHVGVAATVGPVEGEYCPGRSSVCSSGRKLAGSAQRMSRSGWFLGTVLLVDGADDVRPVVRGVYEALGQPCDPATVGAVADLVPGLSVDEMADALLAVFTERVGSVVVRGGRPGLLGRARAAAPAQPVLEEVS